MKRIKGLSTRLISFLLIAALTVSLLPNLGIVTTAASTDTGDTYVYIPVKDLSNAARYEGNIAQNFMDTSLGGSEDCGNYTLLLQQAGDYVEYDIDLDDSVTEAVLKVYAKHAQVSVQASGGELVTLTASNGAAADRGVNLFDLSTADALASADKQFTVRISYNGQAVVLNGLAVVAEQPELTETYELDPLGESYLQSVVDVSAGATRYFLNSTVPTVYLHTNEYVTLYFDYADNVEGINYSYANAGQTLSAEVSTDGSAWTALGATSGKLESVVTLPESKSFYLRFTATAGDSFLHTVTLAPAYAAIDAGKELYLPLNSLTTASDFGGAGVYENFNDTYQGGTNATNPTLLLQQAGDYVEYNFDMDDDVTAAQLKLLTTAGKVEVKTEGGEFVTLTAKNGSGFNRNVAIFDLDETNALAAADNRFTLRISFDGSTVVLNSLLLQAQTAELSESFSLELLGKNYLQHVVDVSAGASRYFVGGATPTVHLHTNEYVTLYFDYADDVAGISYSYTTAGNALTAEVSVDGTAWTALSATGGKLEEAVELPADRAFYLRFTAAAGEGFLQSVSLSPSFEVIEAGKELYLPLGSLSVATKYAGAGVYENFNDTYQGGTSATNPTLLLQQAGDYVEYNFDMDDDVTAAQLKLLTTAGKVEVKPFGGEFVTLTAKNGSGFNRGLAIYDLTESDALAADTNSFTLRISFDGNTVVLNSLLLQAQTTELTEDYALDPLGESYLKQVTDVSAGVSRYFVGGNQASLHIHNGECVVFGFDYADDVSSIVFAFTQAGNTLTAEVSTDGTTWSAIASGSDIPLNDSRSFQIRITAASGEAFLSGLTLAVSYEITGIDAGKELYLPLGSLSVANKYAGAGVYENFNDTYNGGSNATNPTLLLQQAGDYVEYNFDMDDGVTSAWLKILITGGKVEVKSEGGEFVTLTAINGSGFNRGLAIYELNADNALSSAGKRFTLRISFDGGTVVLNALLLQAQTTEITAYTLDPIGESYLKHVTDVSAGISRYFIGGNQASLHMQAGHSVTFSFDFADDVQGALFAFTQAGAALTAEVSADGAAWSTITSGAKVEDVIALSTAKTFYVRFTATGEAFLSGLTLTATYAEVEEKDYIYLPIKDLSNADRFGGGSVVENFEDTYLDGDAAKIDNLTLLLQNAGDYVEYDINLPDGTNAALLKIYMKGGVVSVKPKGGEFVTLTAANGTSFDRNVAIYNLTTANALASDERQFTVRIESAGGAVVINSLMVQLTQPELSDAFELDPLGESYMQHLHHISGTASRYFLNKQDPTVFLHTGDQVTFFFDFADDIESLVYSFGALGKALTAEISTDGATWVTLPAGGRIEEVLALDGTLSFYIRFTAEQGDSFLQTLSITPAEAEKIPEQDYVYLPIKDLSNADSYAGAGLYENFTDTYTGGDANKMTNPTLLLQKPGDYVEYRFNLSDSVTAALLKVYMTDAVVSVKAKGGEFVTLTASNDEGGRFNRGVAIYDLTTANALADGSREFTVRISCNGSATAVLNGLVVDALTQQLGSKYTLEPLGESYLQAVYDLTQSTSRYFHEASYPTVQIKNGGYVVFRMNFAPGGACYPVQYTTLGAQATVEVSLDGINWVPLKGERVDKALNMSNTGTYYLRFSAKDGETFLWKLTASRETTAPVVPTNTNPNVPKDSDYIFFMVGSAEEEKYMFGLGSDYKAYFNGTHSGLGIDGFEGGYSDTLPPNVRLFHGKSVTYEFDLVDDAAEAVLKVYGLGNMVFMVSADDGETWDTLTPTHAPIDNGRGYYIFKLSEADALRGSGNKFRLQIKGTYGILMGMMIETDEPVLTGGVHFDIRGEAGLRYLDSTNGLRTYYADTAFANYFLDDKGYVVFKVPFSDSVKEAILYATYSGDVRIEIAGEDGVYQTLLRSALGASGTPHTNTFDLSEYLAKSSVLYFRVTGSATGGFLDSMGIAVTPSDEEEGGFTVFDDSEAKYLYSIPENGKGIGTAKRVTVDLQKARGIDVGGAVVYRIDLADNVNGVDLLVDAEGKYEITVSIDGVNFVSIVEVGKETDGLRVVDPLPESESKVLYIKITNMSDSDVLVLHGMTFSTKNVPAYERPEAPDFNYDDEIPGEIPGGDKLEDPTEPSAIPGGTTEEPAQDLSWLWIVLGGAALLAVIILIILLLGKKKKKEQE